MRFRWCVIVTVFVLVAAATTAFCLPAGASTADVNPSVSVGSTYGITIENPEVLNWGNQAAGSTQTATLQIKVTANANWELTVGGSNLENDGGQQIPSSLFTYTSSSDCPGSGRTGEQFDSGNQVWTSGSPTSGCLVSVEYSLQIPLNLSPGTYSTTHTYTVCPG